MSSIPVFITIGYHKTGSTWLDRHLLENPDSGFWRPTAKRLRHLIVGPHPLDFDVEACGAQVSAYLSSQPEGKITAIGMERLSGHPHSGGYDVKEIAERLTALFPHAKILIVIREQKRMLLSTYNQYVRDGGSCSLREYMINPQPHRYVMPTFDLDYFCYHRLIHYYIQLFGRSNVLVLPYEMFQAEPKAFVRTILLFNDLADRASLAKDLPYEQHVRPSLSWPSIAILRRLNALIVDRTQSTPHVLFPPLIGRRRLRLIFYRLERNVPQTLLRRCNQMLQRRLMAQVSTCVGSHYEESNAIVAEEMDLDLEQYGYAVPPNASGR